MSQSQRDPAIQRFFAGILEQVFQGELGIADTLLVDYITALLVRSVALSRLRTLRSLKGEPIDSITLMFAEAENRMGEARYRAFRDVGDYALFWCGVYPESLQLQLGISGDKALGVFTRTDKAAYSMADNVARQQNLDIAGQPLDRLSHEFYCCAYGIREARRCWEENQNDLNDSKALIIE